MNKPSSSNASLLLEQHGGTISEGSHQPKPEIVSTKKELNSQVVLQPGVTPHKLDRNARLDVPNFFSIQNPDIFFDWLHNIHDVSKTTNSSLQNPS